jgi:hypothetical protein
MINDLGGSSDLSGVPLPGNGTKALQALKCDQQIRKRLRLH